jgi:hypothetical protein
MDICKFCWRRPYEFSNAGGFLEYAEHLGIEVSNHLKVDI